jgi:hypothetical protein
MCSRCKTKAGVVWITGSWYCTICHNRLTIKDR